MNNKEVLIKVDHLEKKFNIGKNKKLTAVDNVSFNIKLKPLVL